MTGNRWLVLVVTALLCLFIWGCTPQNQNETNSEEATAIVETESATEDPGPTDDWGIGEF